MVRASIILAACAVSVPDLVWSQTSRESEMAELRKRLEKLEAASGGTHATGQAADSRHRPVELGARVRSAEPRLVVRVYDVGDLFVFAPRYDARRESDLGSATGPLFPEAAAASSMTGAPGGLGGMGGGGLGFRSVPIAMAPRAASTPLPQSGEDSRPSLESLIEVIEATISPPDWSSVGGPQSIERLGNVLVVSATTEAHEQLSELLVLLRGRWGSLRTIGIRAYWLWLSAAEIARLVLPEAARSPNEDEYEGAVNMQVWHELLPAIDEADDARPPGYRAALACYNGQTVHVQAHDHRLSITEMMPVVAERAVSYHPKVSVVFTGAALQVTPTATASGKFVVLDLHSRVAHLLQNDEHPPTMPLGGAANNASSTHPPPMIDRPRLKEHRLATTVRIPVNRPVLVAGMTYSPAGNRRELYLFIETRVQELHEVAIDRNNNASPSLPGENGSIQ